MQKNEEIKEIVREKYSELANANQSCGCSCCGTDQGATIDYSIMGDDYSEIDGYFPVADLGLGCGLPTEYAGIKEGNTVLDLGSGAGNDVFIARRSVGSNGRVIGIDFTDAMIDKARQNCDKLGYNNVEFRKGDIEEMPIINNAIDVIVSNCVLNLVPDKNKAFSEMYRVLKPGGHFCVSDIVLSGKLPDGLQNAAAMYTGCVAGALQMDEYLKTITDSGFTDVSIPKQKKINIPDEILSSFISEDELSKYKTSGAEIVSVTVKAKKLEIKSCCG
jgi:arsenite methyltransferase